MDNQLEYAFVTAVFVLDHTTQKISAAEAERDFSETSKENFWQTWPEVREWVESLWQRLEDERRASSRPVEDGDVDDVGGGG